MSADEVGQGSPICGRLDFPSGRKLLLAARRAAKCHLPDDRWPVITNANNRCHTASPRNDRRRPSTFPHRPPSQPLEIGGFQVSRFNSKFQLALL